MRYLLFFYVILITSPVFAEEQWESMLQGLLQRQYYDVAIDYLESLGNSPKCPTKLKDQVDLQIARIHLEALSQGKAPLGAEVHLAQAKNALTRFVQQYPDHAEAYLANRNLGKLFLEELRMLNARIHATGTTEAQKENLRNQAEAKYVEAESAFQRAEQIAYETAKKLRDDPLTKTDPARTVRRDAAYMQVLESRVQLAALPRDRAKIYDSRSAEYRQFLEEAALKCGEVAQKYANYTGSLDAKLMEAKSFFELGNYRQARTLVKELNVLNSTTPQFRAILAEALPLMLELNLKQPTPENLADSLERIRRWTESTTPSTRNEAFYAKTNLLAGATYLKLAQEEKNADSKNAREYHAQSIKFLSSVSVESPESKEALKLLAPLGGTIADTAGEPDETGAEIPETFTDAKLQAERKYQEFLLAQRIFLEASEFREKTKQKAFRDRLAEQAIRLFRTALGFDDAREKVDADQRNAIRLKLATVYWSLDRWEEVIVIGDYLMTHYAATSFGPQGADLSIKAARRMFLDEKAISEKTQTPQDPAMLRRIEKTYDTIATRWEAFPVGQEALSLRIETELDAGSLEQAEKFIDAIPADSDKRATAELKLGAAIWALYVKSEAEKKPDALLEESRLHLDRGFEGKRKELKSGAKIDFTTVSACLVEAQIDLIRKNPTAALTLLDDPDFGPLMLLERESMKTETSPIFGSPDWNGAFKSQILTVALRASLDAGRFDRTDGLVEALDSLFAEGTPEDQGRWIEIYVALGRQLDARLQASPSDENPAQRELVLKTLETLLDRIDSRKAEADDKTLLWLADTYYRLGERLVESPEIEPVAPSEKALAYFEKSESLCLVVQERTGPADPTLRFKLALALRGQGRYGDAYEIFAELIHESENRLDVQVEAAKTLQLWGAADRGNYIKAIVGDAKKPDGQYEIWGWNGILRRVSPRLEKYKSEYFEANYNKAICRILLAQKLTGSEANAMDEGAKKDILRLQQLHPDFGGAPWTSRFSILREKLGLP